MEQAPAEEDHVKELVGGLRGSQEETVGRILGASRPMGQILAGGVWRKEAAELQGDVAGAVWADLLTECLTQRTKMSPQMFLEREPRGLEHR